MNQDSQLPIMTSDLGNIESLGEEMNTLEPAGSEESVFYWKQVRENILTTAGLRLFQIAYSHKDEEYESARTSIDADYEKLSPRLQKKGGETARHGGYFSTYINLLEELGLMYREPKDGKTFLKATPAGDQAALLLIKLPDTLKVIPYFLIELLTRYRFNNPLNKNPKNQNLAKEIFESNIFPYWSLYKIIRSSDDNINKDELARFVFKTKRMEDIPNVISQIKNYRRDRENGLSEEHLNEKYGLPLTGAIAQPKYFMGRAGVQLGIIIQETDNYRLNPQYIPFIDELLKNEPQFQELNEDTWIKQYGSDVEATEPLYLPFDLSTAIPPLTSELPDDDPVFLNVKRLIEEDKFSGVLLIGPPGTGKTWYAKQIAIKIVEGDSTRIREVQFHPSYQYEDFVEGYIPDGKGGFRLVDRHLLEMCNAANKLDKPHVLIIDELSRTDPARVMGEALTYMETSLREQTFYLPSGRKVKIPRNLIFLATMNPEDRSVDEIDAAMDRRWGKEYLAPDPTVLRKFLLNKKMVGEDIGEVSQFFVWIQQHFKLGHAFFRTVKDRNSLVRLWDNQLRFIFEKAFRYDPETLQEIQQRWEQVLTAIDSRTVQATSTPSAEEPAVERP